MTRNELHKELNFFGKFVENIAVFGAIATAILIPVGGIAAVTAFALGWIK